MHSKDLGYFVVGGSYLNYSLPSAASSSVVFLGAGHSLIVLLLLLALATYFHCHHFESPVLATPAGVAGSWGGESSLYLKWVSGVETLKPPISYGSSGAP